MRLDATHTKKYMIGLLTLGALSAYSEIPAHEVLNNMPGSNNKPLTPAGCIRANYTASEVDANSGSPQLADSNLVLDISRVNLIRRKNHQLDDNVTVSLSEAQTMGIKYTQTVIQSSLNAAYCAAQQMYMQRNDACATKIISSVPIAPASFPEANQSDDKNGLFTINPGYYV